MIEIIRSAIFFEPAYRIATLTGFATLFLTARYIHRLTRDNARSVFRSPARMIWIMNRQIS